jgi:beta-ureidopropionase / N-carbamoyl-L-amino-acid hydrolase
MHNLSINAERLLDRIRTLGDIGRDEAGRLTRLAASDTDRLGREAFVGWARTAGLDVKIDRIGNIFAIWAGEARGDPLLLGSHLDTVIDAGMLDGCYGVLAGLEVIETMKESGVVPPRPVIAAAFTNEEGTRFAPDMMGSAVFAGTLPLDEALAAVGTDGTILGGELERIGFAGSAAPGFFKPHAYLELHIEQGPILEREATAIGAVDAIQGISWQKITICGEANHAGTAPMSTRRDAGYAAARVIDFLHRLAHDAVPDLVTNVGCLSLSPNAINVVPGEAVLTVDMRCPAEEGLVEGETRLAAFIEELRGNGMFSIATERLARTAPVRLDESLVRLVETAAKDRGLSLRRMASGAGHDAKMLAEIAPAAMIFVPSVGGISHNPREYTSARDLVAGANVLLDTARAVLTAN